MLSTWTVRIHCPTPLASHQSRLRRPHGVCRIRSSPPDSKTTTPTESVVLEAPERELESLPDGFIESNEVLPHRWILTVAMSAAFVLCNMDKVNMSVAVIPMARELNWSATARGLVQSAFFWGYTITQVPAGWMSTKIGGEKVLFTGVLLWSIGTFLAPSAAHLGFLMLCASRVLVGLAEGLSPSSATSVLSKQVPAGERSRAVATVFGGLDLGSAIGLLLCGPLIRHYGWPSVFHIFAISGFVWCLGWPFLKPNLRDATIWRSKSKVEKLKFFEENKLKTKVPWKEILKSGPVWAIIAAHFCYNWGYFTLLAWLPSFFELALHLNVQDSSFLTVIPYLSMTFMTPFVGPTADLLVERGMSVTSVRKLCQGVSFLGPAICMLSCSWFVSSCQSNIDSTTVSFIVVLLSASFALGAWARGGLYCNHQDLSPRFASALLGISNTAGAVPGILGVSSTGLLFDMYDDWSIALFYPIILSQIVGIVIYTIFADSEPPEWS
eukprot:g4357.t1